MNKAIIRTIIYNLKFNDTWRSKYNHQSWCDSNGNRCAMGWFSTLPEAKAVGFSCKHTPQYQNNCGLEAIAACLDLDLERTTLLFGYTSEYNTPSSLATRLEILIGEDVKRKPWWRFGR